MRIVIVGGGIAAVYLANALSIQPQWEVVIVSEEEFPPYDRIHLCGLVDHSKTLDAITLHLNPRVCVELNQKITAIDSTAKRVLSDHAAFHYDKLIIATGSNPKSLFDISHIDNAATFRSVHDCERIAKVMVDKNVVIVGAGPIALELLDTLMKNDAAKTITLIVRSDYLYSRELNPLSIALIRTIFESDPRITIDFNDAIVDREVVEGTITRILTKKGKVIEDPFLIFGVGIDPNIAFARETLACDKGVLVNAFMQTSDENIYCVGEAAQLREGGFIAGRVKECTMQAHVAIAHLLGKEPQFKPAVTMDGLKVGSFLFADLTAPDFNPKDPHNETILLSHADRIDQYIVNNDRLKRFIGINTNTNLLKLKSLMEQDDPIDVGYFYSNRVMSENGRLVCSCEGVHEQELVKIIREHGVTSFAELEPFSTAGRTCGRCKHDVCALIASTPIDPKEALERKRNQEASAKEGKLAMVRERIAKYNRIHPQNQLSGENLQEALDSFEMRHEFNRWISMVTASMHLHPDYEEVVKEGVTHLNKIPIIWLELADCSGNSEAFIKTSHPTVDDLILKYLSLDYHELLMAGSGDQSETALDAILHNDHGAYILIVEGAVPLGLEGKFLRIGAKGETGLALLERVASGAAAVIAVGSCAYDGGVVAAEPNPTGAVGVAQALHRTDIINLPGCPTNPINVVGTLLHYIMFEEFPKLDEKNRPQWAYSFRIHDNCERRGHYDMEEFVREWGDEGAKKGWCLFQMGCKGPYANLNCSLVKFNEGTSWPVQVGHGCFGCGEGKIAFDHYANNRPLEEKSDEN